MRAALVAWLLLISSPAAAATACQAAKPAASSHWSWRQIEGRRCWYEGRPGRGKGALFWPATRTMPLPPARPPEAPQAELLFDQRWRLR